MAAAANAMERDGQFLYNMTYMGTDPSMKSLSSHNWMTTWSKSKRAHLNHLIGGVLHRRDDR